MHVQACVNDHGESEPSAMSMAFIDHLVRNHYSATKHSFLNHPATQTSSWALDGSHYLAFRTLEGEWRLRRFHLAMHIDLILRYQRAGLS